MDIALSFSCRAAWSSRRRCASTYGEVVAEEKTTMAPAVSRTSHTRTSSCQTGTPSRRSKVRPNSGSRVERGLDDPLELEIRLDRRLVDVAGALRRASPPVVRQSHARAQSFFPPPAPGPAGRRDPPSRGGAPAPRRGRAATHGLRRLGHGIVEPVMGEARVAEYARALGAQRHHLGNDRLVVGWRRRRRRARSRREKSSRAGRAARRTAGRLDARARSGDGVLAGKVTLLGRRPRRRAHESGRPARSSSPSSTSA